MKRLYLILLLLFQSCVCTAEQAWVLVGHIDENLNLDRDAIKNIYLNKAGAKRYGVTVYDHKSIDLRTSFYENYLRLSLVELRAYWAKQVFTGGGRPPSSLDTDELIERLNSERNSIGYLPADRAGALPIILGSDQRS